jgi:hypothetical protein
MIFFALNSPAQTGADDRAFTVQTLAHIAGIAPWLELGPDDSAEGKCARPIKFGANWIRSNAATSLRR